MTASTRTRILALTAVGLGLLVAVPSTASAAGDRDRDGLSNQRERKIGTSPNRADTDRDRLKDGREVRRVRTNPLRADTDGDVIKDGRELLLGLDPLDPDSDDDGCSDRLERKGVILAITDSSVTIEGRRGIETTLTVDSDTYFEGVDRDGDRGLARPREAVDARHGLQHGGHIGRQAGADEDVAPSPTDSDERRE